MSTGTETLTLAKAFCGSGEDEEAALALLCTAAEERLTRQLREGISQEDCGPAFHCAAAAMAAADLWACRCGRNTVASFSVGELSVHEKDVGKASAAAQELRQTAKRMMAPYTVNGDFCFFGVRG
jgi:hypothetical protein